MREKLKLKLIHDDFISRTTMTDEQMKILEMYIAGDTAIKIAFEIGCSQRTANYEIKKLKELFDDYCSLEKSKVEVLQK